MTQNSNRLQGFAKKTWGCIAPILLACLILIAIPILLIGSGIVTSKLDENWCTNFPVGATKEEFIAQGKSKGFEELELFSVITSTQSQPTPTPERPVVSLIKTDIRMGLLKFSCYAQIENGRVTRTNFSAWD